MTGLSDGITQEELGHSGGNRPAVFNSALGFKKKCSICERQPLTHSGRENHNPQHVHALAGARRGLHDDIRGRREIQREVLHVSAVVILDAVDVDPPRGGLIQELSHRGLGDELRDPLGAVL